MQNGKITQLDLKQMKVQLKAVDAAREEMEFRVQEREEDIARLKANIAIQDKKIAELQQKIADGEAVLAASVPAENPAKSA